jgi:16S rRNA (cytosine967-C5)-methyltransferase
MPARPAHPGHPGTRRRASARRAGGRPADLPRRTAYDVLAAVADRDAYANLLLPRLLAERSLTGRDAALATELAYGTLRGLGTYDAVLAACSDRPLNKLDPPVLQVLRLGAHQLLATRVGGHAAVATSVDLVKAVAGPRASGYVNAVLRRVATRDLDEWLAIVAPDQESDPDGYLSVRYSYPRWIIRAYRDALGEAAASELAAALAAGDERPRVTMAVYPGGPARDEVMPEGAEPTRWSPYGFTLSGGDPSALIAAGHATVQDEGSQLAAIALAKAPLASAPTGEVDDAAETLGGAPPAPVRDGERWLDMCAGPGGKARLLRGLAATAGARLVASDVHPHRAELIQGAFAGHGTAGTATSAVLGHGTAGTAASAVLVADGRRPAWCDGVFDRVLVDVPCSGLGALRRRPEARWRKSESDLPALAELQRALLRSALAACRPGGVVAYVTCSPVKAETRDVVNAVLGDTPGVEVLDAAAILSNVPGLRSPDPRFAQLWPHRHATDAIFIALLRRTAREATPAGRSRSRKLFLA